MAINNISSSLNGLSNKTSSAKTSKQGATSESSSSSVSKGTVAQDTVKLTEHAQSLSSLQQKITDAPDTDDNKVASIKAAIANGDYKINSDRIAGKMLAQENALFGDNK
nr:flagellar biosynthesis anti-sigma factor FlgM [uncultured Tolumonas sp.]